MCHYQQIWVEQGNMDLLKRTSANAQGSLYIDLFAAAGRETSRFSKCKRVVVWLDLWAAADEEEFPLTGVTETDAAWVFMISDSLWSCWHFHSATYRHNFKKPEERPSRAEKWHKGITWAATGTAGFKQEAGSVRGSEVRAAAWLWTGSEWQEVSRDGDKETGRGCFENPASALTYCWWRGRRGDEGLDDVLHRNLSSIIKESCGF